MAEITPVVPGPDGAAVVLGDAAAGDEAKCGHGYGLLVLNGSGSPITVTLAVPGNTATGEANPDNVITVAAGAYRIIPLLDIYKDPENDRLAQITWSSTTTVDRAVIKL